MRRESKLKRLALAWAWAVTLLAALALPAPLAAQQNRPNVVDQLVVVAPPVPVPSVSASYNGSSGSAQHCYWVVAVFTAGDSLVGNPACIQNAASLSVADKVEVGWSSIPEATQYRVIRTSNPVLGTSCSSCLLTTTTATSITDDGSFVAGNFTQSGVLGRPQATIRLDQLEFSPARVESSRPLSPGSLGTGTPSASTVLLGNGSWGASPGGGAPTDAEYWLGTANGELSAEIVVNDINSLQTAIAGYDFSDASNLDTGDLAAARMATNWGTAGTSACATSGGVMFDDGSAVGCDSNFTFSTSSQALTVGTGYQILASGGSSSAPGFAFSSITNTGFWLRSNGIVFVSGGTDVAEMFNNRLRLGSGGSFEWSPLTSPGAAPDLGLVRHSAGVVKISDGSTGNGAIFASNLIFQDPTASTGDTLFICKGGAGETGNCLEIQDNAGTTTAGITEDGKAAVTALDINDGGTRPTCDSDERGTMWFDEGGAGVKDDLSVCAKDAGDAYAWRSIY